MQRNNVIHPTAIIDDSVAIGTGNTIGPYVVITGQVELGDDNWIGPHVVIGAPAEHQAFHQPGKAPAPVDGGIMIGSRCIIHEHIAIQAPTTGNTVIGSEAFLMHGVHIPHDAIIEEAVTIAPMAVLGGHAFIGSGATIGMGAVIHQRRRIGPLAMVAMQASVVHDVAPCSVVVGNPARFMKVNQIALDKISLEGGPWEQELLKPFDVWDFSLFPEILQLKFKTFSDALNSR